MATVFCHVNIVSRANGHSAVAEAAYRAGVKIKNHFTGKTHNYSYREDVVHHEILAPRHAPPWVYTQAILWNEVEKVEPQTNSQLARQFVIALQRELSREQNIQFARNFAKILVEKGMVVDLTIHDNGNGNEHAHLMATMRPFNPDGTWGAKCRKEYILDEYGNRIKLESGRYKSRRVNTTDWDNKENVEIWRENYATLANEYFEKYGHKVRIDHRSFERQGLEQSPTQRISRKSWELEKHGIQTLQGDKNREIQEQNRQREAINQELAKLKKEQEEILAGQEKKMEVATESPKEQLHGVDRYRNRTAPPKLVRDPGRNRRYVNHKEAERKQERRHDREQHPNYKAEPRHGADRYRQRQELVKETDHSPPQQRRSIDRYRESDKHHEREHRQPSPERGKDYERDS